MTETTADIETKIDWPAFIGALITAPVIGLLIGLPLLSTAVISAELGALAFFLIFAPFFGFKTYLLVGAPFFAVHIRLFGTHPLGLALTGFLANYASRPLVIAMAEHAGRNGQSEAEFIVGCGMLIAPIWGGIFGILYGLVRAKPVYLDEWSAT